MSDDPRARFRRLINSEDETHAEPPSQPVPPPQPVSHRSYPAVDKDNMPLPHRVTETDVDGTRVTPAAFNSRTSPTRRTGPRAAKTAAPSTPQYRFNVQKLRFTGGAGGGSRWRNRLIVTFIVMAF